MLSPKAGTIKEIRVSEGEAIGEGQLVAILPMPSNSVAVDIVGFGRPII